MHPDYRYSSYDPWDDYEYIYDYDYTPPPPKPKTNMKVISHIPEPIPTPPPTFDLVGLSLEELQKLHAVLGRTSAAAGLSALYSNIEVARLPFGKNPFIVDGPTIYVTKR
jgi:hypothetical protein